MHGIKRIKFSTFVSLHVACTRQRSVSTATRPTVEKKTSKTAVILYNVLDVCKTQIQFYSVLANSQPFICWPLSIARCTQRFGKCKCADVSNLTLEDRHSPRAGWYLHASCYHIHATTHVQENQKKNRKVEYSGI